jgi:hypothetical protein
VTARRKEPTESAIYIDRACVGTVLVEEKGRVIALDGDGKVLGVYATDKQAMSAIIAEARGRAA